MYVLLFIAYNGIKLKNREYVMYFGLHKEIYFRLLWLHEETADGN